MGIFAGIKNAFKGPQQPKIEVKANRSILTNEVLQENKLNQALYQYISKVAAVMNVNPENLINQGFLRNATVYSIIKRKQNAATNIPWLLYEITDQKAYSRALQLKQQMAIGKDGRPPVHVPMYALFSKSQIREVESHRIYDIIEQPNPTQTWTQLTESYIGYLNGLGNAYEYGIGPKNGVNKGQFHEIWDLPAQLVSVKPDLDNARLVSEYIVKYMYENPIPSEQVSHIKYWNPMYGSDLAQFYGLSPLQAARYTVQQSNDNIDSMLSQLQNIGAMGIIAAKSVTNDEPSFNQDQAVNLQSEYKQNFTGTSKRGKVMFSPGAIEWHQLGMSPVDLAIIESMNLTDRQICNAFAFPSLLIGDSTQKTFANYKEAKKALYTDSVIPDLIKLKDARNRWFLKGFNQAENKRYILDLDYTAVPELQEDIKDMIAAYKDAYWITNNEKRNLMKYGETANDGDNTTWIPSSYVDPSATEAPINEALKELGKYHVSDYN